MVHYFQDVVEPEKVTPDPKLHRAATSTSSVGTASTDEPLVKNLMAELEAVMDGTFSLVQFNFHTLHVFL